MAAAQGWGTLPLRLIPSFLLVFRRHLERLMGAATGLAYDLAWLELWFSPTLFSACYASQCCV